MKTIAQTEIDAAINLYDIELEARRLRAEAASAGIRFLREWIAAKVAGLRGASLHQPA